MEAPSSANFRAIPLPIPRPEPVITATFPNNLLVGLSVDLLGIFLVTEVYFLNLIDF